MPVLPPADEGQLAFAPMRWLGDRGSARLKTQVMDVLGAWRAEWAYGESLPELRAGIVGPQQRATLGPKAISRLACSARTGVAVSVHATSDALEHWLGLPRSMDARRMESLQNPLARSVLSEALDALLQRVCEVADVPPTHVVLQDGPTDDMTSGTVWLSIEAGGESPGALMLVLGLSRWAVEALVPRARPEATDERLVERVEAIESERLRVEVALGSCAVSMAEWRQIGPGDVLLLERGAGAPAKLQVAGRTATFASVAVGANGGAWAARVESWSRG